LDEVATHLDDIGQGGKPLILSEIGAAAAIEGWRDWERGPLVGTISGRACWKQ